MRRFSACTHASKDHESPSQTSYISLTLGCSTITYLAMFREMAELHKKGIVNKPDGTAPLTGVLVGRDVDSSDEEDADQSNG